MLDQSIAEFANRIAQHQPARLLALVAASWLLAVPILALLWVAVGAIRRRQPQTLTVLALAAVGAGRLRPTPARRPPVLSAPPLLGAPGGARYWPAPRRQLVLLP